MWSSLSLMSADLVEPFPPNHRLPFAHPILLNQRNE